MEVKISEYQGVTVVTVSGRMETEDAFRLKKKLGELRHGGGRNFILDLHSVPFLNSYALGILIHIRTEIRNAGGEMALASPEENISLLFDMVGLKQFMEIYPTIEGAFKFLEKKGITLEGPES